MHGDLNAGNTPLVNGRVHLLDIEDVHQDRIFADVRRMEERLAPEDQPGDHWSEDFRTAISSYLTTLRSRGCEIDPLINDLQQTALERTAKTLQQPDPPSTVLQDLSFALELDSLRIRGPLVSTANATALAAATRPSRAPGVQV